MIGNKVKKIFFLLVILSVQNLWATDYYISSSSGNDGNSGTSSSSPWRTLGKIKFTIFKPGDKILFKAGDTWNEKLVTAGNGSSSNPITYSSYGSGNKPIINGIAANQGMSVDFSARNYVKITGLHVKTQGVGIYIYGSNNVVENCFIEGTNKSSYNLIGIGVYGNSNGTIIRSNEVRYVTEGIKVAPTSSCAVIVEKNYIHDLNAGNPNDQDGIGFGNKNIDMSGSYIRNNHITKWGDDGIDMFFGRNIIVENNDIHDPMTSAYEGNGIKVGGNSSGTEYGIIIRYNKIYNLYTSPYGGGSGGNTGILIQDGNMEVYSNLIYNTEGCGIIFHGGSGSKAFNNTVIVDNNVSKSAIQVNYNPSVTIKNNILSAPAGVDLSANGATVYGGYNCLVNDNSVSGNSRYQNSNSSDFYNKNPLFVNASAKDFRLQTNSPCYRTGTSLISGLLDLTGLPALLGVNPNRGAYQTTGEAPSSGDNTAPKVTAAQLNGNNILIVTFSESLDKGYAESESNYSINNGVSVSNASLTSNNVVTLNTSNHAVNSNFILTVKNTKDLAGNASSSPQTAQYQSGQSSGGDNTSLQVINAQLNSATSLVITFSKGVDRGYAENKSNYSISNISISRASLTGSNQVTLTTSSHSENTNYTIKVLHAKDLSGKAVMNLSYQYQYGKSSGTGSSTPQVTNAQLSSSTSLVITFSEGVDRGYAENRSNYSINNISISKASLTSSNQVTLTTSSHSSNYTYTLKVLHAKDLDGNAVMNLSYQYQLSGNSTSNVNTLSIDNINASSYQPGYIPANTTDGKGYNSGDADSRWIARNSGFQELIYDLGSVKKVSNTKISFYGFNSNAKYTYSVSLSSSKKSWSTVVSRKVSGNSEWSVDNFSAADVRYVKITIHSYQNVSIASLWEVQIAGNSQLGKADVETIEQVPEQFELHQNYPNPFNPTTTIKYTLPLESSVKLTVYNMLGEVVSELVNRVEQTGSYEFNWNASHMASGTYIYSIEASPVDGSQGFKLVKKMMLLK